MIGGGVKVGQPSEPIDDVAGIVDSHTGMDPGEAEKLIRRLPPEDRRVCIQLARASTFELLRRTI